MSLRAAIAVAAFGGLLLASPAHGWEHCFVQAGARYSVSPLLLRAIARQESSFNPRAVNTNTNGTRDIGVMQINTFWLGTLSQAGITEESLFEPCLNIHVGAWVLANEIQRHGLTWKAVGAYHSPTEWRQKDYAARIHRHLARELRALGKDVEIPPAPPRLPTPPAAVPLGQLAQAERKPAGGVWEADSAPNVDTASRSAPEAPEGERAGG